MGDARKRFARRQWARRWLTWRYVVGLLLVLVVMIGGVYLVFFSSSLSVQGVEVSGTQTLSEKKVREVAAVPTGGPLATVDLDKIAYRVRSLAVVKSAEVTRKWPHDVLIEVVERQPVAVVEIAGALHSLDEEGVVFGSYSRPPDGLPRVRAESGVNAEALAEGAGVVAALPTDLATKVDFAEVISVDQITLRLRDGREVLWGSADQSADKADVLAGLLVARPKAQSYDVSVPGMPTTS
ncbi:MAG TPA: FtsQ-type POTRA domain-containing protein [Nocardioides sp.]|nr:FtsQ-type POTRA domain-containing protein [Nocardioides sp.]